MCPEQSVSYVSSSSQGLPVSVGPLFYQRREILESFSTISEPRSIRAAALDKCSGAKWAYRKTISYDFQPVIPINSSALISLKSVL